MADRPYISDRVIILDPNGTGAEPLVKSCARCSRPFAPTERKHAFCSSRCRDRERDYRRRARLRVQKVDPRDYLSGDLGD